MKNLRIAWRNLWRNRRRTLITMASVFFGVLLSSLMTSMQEGMYSKMIDNVVKLYTGYLQVQHPDYWDKKTINHTFRPGDSLYDALERMEEVKEFVPRLESFSLISTGDETRGGALIGVDPVAENNLTDLERWLEKGSYLEPGDEGILLTYNLAENYDASIGDTLILISQGYHGASAEGLFPLRGIIRFPSPALNNMGAYISLEKAKEFYWSQGRITSVVIMLEDYSDMEDVEKKLRDQFSGRYRIMTWDEMQPELKQMIEADRAGGIIMKAILYMVIGFGILGTVIMMLSERKREMGVMIAIGMKKARLIPIMIFEIIMIGLLGVIAGFIGSIPVIAFFVNNPIPLPDRVAEAYSDFGIEPVIYFSSQPEVFINQAVTVFVITLVISIYPLVHTLRMEAVEALHS